MGTATCDAETPTAENLAALDPFLGLSELPEFPADMSGIFSEIAAALAQAMKSRDDIKAYQDGKAHYEPARAKVRLRTALLRIKKLAAEGRRRALNNDVE